MKTVLLLSSLWLAFSYISPPPSAPSPQATYRYQLEHGQVLLHFRIDTSLLEDFEFFAQCGHLSRAEVLCLASYLNSGIDFKIGKQVLDFEVLGAHEDQRDFVVEMIALGEIAVPYPITIRNDCFLEFAEDFTNQIYVLDNGYTRSYQLTEARQELEIKRKR